MAETTPLRVAVVGCGSIGRRHVRAVMHSPHAVLVGVCDSQEQHAVVAGTGSTAAVFTSYEQMFQSTRLDAVLIATPDHLHVEPVLSAIEHGLHVFCEKPLASSLDQALEVVSAAGQRGVRLGVDYNRRFGFGYRKAREILDSSAGSPVRQAMLHVCDGIPRSVANQQYSLLTSLVSHHLDLMRWLGGEIVALHATMRGPTEVNPHRVAIVLESATGMIGSISASWREGQTRTLEQLQMTTDGQVIVVDDVQQEVRIWHDSPDDIQVFRPNPFHRGNLFYDTVEQHVSAFLESIVSGQRPPVSGIDGCVTLQLIESVIESHSTGKRIVIPILPETLCL